MSDVPVWGAARVSDLLLGGVFVLAALASIGVSWVLVIRLERIGARLGLSEALLGMLAALVADVAWTSWLVAAISEEQTKLEVAIHPDRGRARDALIAAGAVVVVVGASVAMERAATAGGSSRGVWDRGRRSRPRRVSLMR
jgi:hypothetical protein